MFAVLSVSGPLHLLLGGKKNKKINQKITVACYMDFCERWASGLKGLFGSREKMRAEGSPHPLTYQI